MSATDLDPAVTRDEPAQLPETGEVKPHEAAVAETKEKKKKKRSGRGAKKRGTGFEEFFCDPPVTPEEHIEEKTVIYPPHRPFVDRIEECIQRFRARRRMDNERENLFSKYLTLGGVDATVRQFQSTRKLNAEDLEGKTKADTREITADDVIQRGSGESHDRRFYNPHHAEHWSVDFAGVAAGFCSEYLADLVGIHGSEYKTGVEVVFNFLKYVEHHDVCPEYAEDIKQAQKVCGEALEQMPAISNIVARLPGSFNAAATHLFCGRNETVDEPDDSVEVFEFHDTSDDWQTTDKPLDDATARTIFGTAVAILFDRKFLDLLDSSEKTVVHTVERIFEICEINLADDELRAKYKLIKDHLTKTKGIKVDLCGSMVVRPTVVRDGWDNSFDLTLPETAVENFILEEDILEHMKVGMKMAMTVCTLDVGLKFIKNVKWVRPTFYTFLPQQLMVHFKEPVPNRRPGPSVHNPDEVDEILRQIPIGDMDLDD